jgi:hypothetical protein
MPANFSPTAQAARLHAVRRESNPPFAGPASPAPAPVRQVMTAAGERWCEWPRRAPSNPPFTSIRQALLAIQARHA